jgi:hypothetical protein
MAEAALMAGLAFSNTKTALAHSLSYDITLQHGVPHGLACSFSLPLVLEMALGADAAADAALLSIFDAGTPAAAVERLRSVLQGWALPPIRPTMACRPRPGAPWCKKPPAARAAQLHSLSELSPEPEPVSAFHLS